MQHTNDTGSQATPEYETDVLVVGAGIAGTTAALAAREAGLRVVLIEKTAAAGGSSAMSGGFFAFSGTEEQADRGESDSPELFRADLVAAGGGVADERLIDAYLDEQAATYAWLKQHGVEFDDIEISSGQSAARSHHSNIKATIARLVREFTASGGELLTSTRVTKLVTDAQGRVVGVDALEGWQPDADETAAPVAPTRIRAERGVVLASGGFSRGRDLLQIFAPDQLDAIPYGGLGNTGDGIKLAWELGAGMADMGYISGTYGSHPETGMEFHELLTAYYLGAIIVNTDGLRFVDESQSYKVLGRECLKQPEGLGFEIFDSVVRAKSHPGIPLVDIGALEDIGHVYKADTLVELARVAGIGEAGLVETVQRYNAVVEGEEIDPLGRTALVNGVGALLPIRTAPFYAYPAKTLMTTTYCGVTITPRAEVLSVTGAVIEGLFAIGEVTGGFHGQAYMTGTSLGKGAVFGRIAAAQLAASVTGPRAETVSPAVTA